MKRSYRTLTVGTALALVLTMAACGDDDDTAGNGATTAGGAPTGTPAGTAAATTAGGTETTAGGTTGGTEGGGDAFTIGFTNPLGSNDQLSVLQSAIEARAECLGGSVISVDANLDVDKQISDIDQLVSQGVDGIIVFPLDAGAVEPAVQRAADAGIKTIGVNASLEDPTAASVAPFDASVNQGTEQMATETAEFVADQLGGTGNVLGVGIGVPVPVIQYQMAAMQDSAESLGLTWLDQVDNPTDDAAGAQPVVEQALLRFDDLKAIMAYNEPSALGAYAAVNSAGRTNDILITAANGTESGIQAVEAGEIAATWDLLPWKQGITFVDVLKAVIDGQPVDTTTVVPVQMLTEDNLSEQVDWNKAVDDIRSCTLEE
ncbi:MAG: sugar ABC transporter substrate-binding protein [Ilumatobacteraceae bacterium]